MKPLVEEPVADGRDDLVASEEQVTVLRSEGHQPAIGAGARRAAGSTDRARRAPTPAIRRRSVSALRRARSPAEADRRSSRRSRRRSTPGADRPAPRAARPPTVVSPVAPGPRLRLARALRTPARRAGPRARGRRRGHPGPTRTPPSAARRRQVRPSGHRVRGRPRNRVFRARVPARRSRRRARASPFPSGDRRPTSAAVSRRTRPPTHRDAPDRWPGFGAAIRSSAGIRSGSIEPQLDAPPEGGFAGEQRHRGGGQRVHVRCHRRSRPGCDLRCDVPGRPRPAQVVGRRGRQSEVDEDDPAGGGEDQVRRLDVSVDDGWIVSVEVLQRLGDLFEVADQASAGSRPGSPSTPSNASRSVPSIQSIAMT